MVVLTGAAWRLSRLWGNRVVVLLVKDEMKRERGMVFRFQLRVRDVDVDMDDTGESPRSRGLMYPLTALIRSFHRSVYNKDSLIMGISIPYASLSRLVGTPSKFNEYTFSTAANALVRAVLHGIPPSEVALLTPYQSQHLMHHRLTKHLERRWPGHAWSEVTYGKFDSIQGSQCAYCIFDCVVDERIGFMYLINRSNSGFSRAAFGSLHVYSRNMTQYANFQKSGLAPAHDYLRKRGFLVDLEANNVHIPDFVDLLPSRLATDAI